MKKLMIAFIVVTASGCTDISELAGEEKDAELISKVSDQRITGEDPGELTLNARNRANGSNFYFTNVEPVGDYDEVVEITDMEGNPKTGFGLGDAPKGATTGETFAKVEKQLNITSTVKVRVELNSRESDEVIDSDVKKLRLVEE